MNDEKRMIELRLVTSTNEQANEIIEVKGVEN